MSWGMGVYRMKLKYYSNCRFSGDSYLQSLPIHLSHILIPQCLRVPGPVLGVGAVALTRTNTLLHNNHIF